MPTIYVLSKNNSEGNNQIFSTENFQFLQLRKMLYITLTLYKYIVGANTAAAGGGVVKIGYHFKLPVLNRFESLR